MPYRSPFAVRTTHAGTATAAALATLLVLYPSHATADAVTKCVVHGVTTYSDRPCPDAGAERNFSLDKTQAVSIVAAETRMASAVRSARCDAAQAELHNIDVLSRQGQPPDMQAFLDARRQQKRNEQFRWRC